MGAGSGLTPSLSTNPSGPINTIASDQRMINAAQDAVQALYAIKTEMANLTTVGATSQKSIAAPTAPASTSAYAMQGLAGSITPAVTGNVLISINGTVVSPSGTTAGLGISYQLSYGTGSAPANAGTLAGTQIGTIQTYTNSGTVTAVDVNIPFSLSAVVTGLTVGVAYWLDLAAKSLGTVSDMGLSAISVTAVELR